MKFAFITTMQGSPWGGSEELWAQTATRLRQSGHDARAWVMYRPQLSPNVRSLAKLGVGIETYPSPSFAATRGRRVWDRISLRYRRSYAQLKNFSPDLVLISQGHNAGGFEWADVCLNAGIPYAVVIHCNSERWWYEERELQTAVRTYTNARKVFCVSQGNLRLLRLQVGDLLRNSEVVWNPHNAPADPVLTWPNENGVWRFASVGRLDPAPKGQDLLLQVLAQAEWRSRPIEVNFFGEGPHKRTLVRMAEMLGLKNVFFRGYQSDINSIWQQNHMLLLPSRYEGLPLALIEAMWCARPAIVTEVGGNAEVCIDGQTGFVASSATVSSFADAMERAWDRRTEWPDFGRSARATVESMLPKDPVGQFCELLLACVPTDSRGVSAVAQTTQSVASGTMPNRTQ